MKLPEYWIAEFKYKVERVIKWLLARDLNCQERLQMHSVISDRKFEEFLGIFWVKESEGYNRERV